MSKSRPPIVKALPPRTRGTPRKITALTRRAQRDAKEPELSGVNPSCPGSDPSKSCEWVTEALTRTAAKRDERWSEAIAVGSEAFVAKVKRELRSRASSRVVVAAEQCSVLREERAAYTRDFDCENGLLSRKTGGLSKGSGMNAKG